MVALAREKTQAQISLLFSDIGAYARERGDIQVTRITNTHFPIGFCFMRVLLAFCRFFSLILIAFFRLLKAFLFAHKEFYFFSTPIVSRAINYIKTCAFLETACERVSNRGRYFKRLFNCHDIKRIHKTCDFQIWNKSYKQISMQHYFAHISYE